jgi:hypothetical protein
MPVGEPRKQRRVRNLAAEHRQKRKERTGKKQIQEEIGCQWQQDDPPCRIDNARETSSGNTGLGTMLNRNPGRMGVWEEMLEGPGMQQQHKVPRC